MSSPENHSNRMTSKSQRREEQIKSRTKKALSKMSPESTCQFYIVRHGETEWNVQHMLQGQLKPGPPLNSRGRKQAHALALALSTTHFDAVYSSDLLRSIETTMHIIQNNNTHTAITTTTGVSNHASDNFILATELRERYLGILEGLTVSEAREKHPLEYTKLSSQHNIDRPDLYNPNFEHSNKEIETTHALQTRVGTFIERIATKHQGQKILIVTHGGALHALYRYATGRPPPHKASNASVSRVYVDTKENKSTMNLWAVTDWADESHLQHLGVLNYNDDVNE